MMDWVAVEDEVTRLDLIEAHVGQRCVLTARRVRERHTRACPRVRREARAVERAGTRSTPLVGAADHLHRGLHRPGRTSGHRRGRGPRGTPRPAAPLALAWPPGPS